MCGSLYSVQVFFHAVLRHKARRWRWAWLSLHVCLMLNIEKKHVDDVMWLGIHVAISEFGLSLPHTLRQKYMGLLGIEY